MESIHTRHSGLTQKAQKLTAPVLNQYANWTARSDMDSRTSLFGNKANDISYLKYTTGDCNHSKSKKLSSVIMPNICAQCNETNMIAASVQNPKWF